MSNDRINPIATAPSARATPVATRKEVAAVTKDQRVQANAPQPTEEPRPSAERIKAVAEQLESYLKSVNRALEFRVDSGSGKTVVTVRDSETGDVIRQIPNEEVLHFAQMAEDQTIVLVNEKA